MGGRVDLLTALWCESGFLAEAETGRGVRRDGRRRTCTGHRAGRAAAVCTETRKITLLYSGKQIAVGITAGIT